MFQCGVGCLVPERSLFSLPNLNSKQTGKQLAATGDSGDVFRDSKKRNLTLDWSIKFASNLSQTNLCTQAPLVSPLDGCEASKWTGAREVA